MRRRLRPCSASRNDAEFIAAVVGGGEGLACAYTLGYGQLDGEGGGSLPARAQLWQDYGEATGALGGCLWRGSRQRLSTSQGAVGLNLALAWLWQSPGGAAGELGSRIPRGSRQGGGGVQLQIRIRIQLPIQTQRQRHPQIQLQLWPQMQLQLWSQLQLRRRLSSRERGGCRARGGHSRTGRVRSSGNLMAMLVVRWAAVSALATLSPTGTACRHSPGR